MIEIPIFYYFPQITIDKRILLLLQNGDFGVSLGSGKIIRCGLNNPRGKVNFTLFIIYYPNIESGVFHKTS